eukprot:gene17349-biopygen11379
MSLRRRSPPRFGQETDPRQAMGGGGGRLVADLPAEKKAHTGSSGRLKRMRRTRGKEEEEEKAGRCIGPVSTVEFAILRRRLRFFLQVFRGWLPLGSRRACPPGPHAGTTYAQAPGEPLPESLSNSDTLGRVDPIDPGGAPLQRVRLGGRVGRLLSGDLWVQGKRYRSKVTLRSGDTLCRAQLKACPRRPPPHMLAAAPTALVACAVRAASCGAHCNVSLKLPTPERRRRAPRGPPAAIPPRRSRAASRPATAAAERGTRGVGGGGTQRPPRPPPSPPPSASAAVRAASTPAAPPRCARAPSSCARSRSCPRRRATAITPTPPSARPPLGQMHQ